MLNSIILMGRLTRDPELRKTATDKSVVNFTLAFDNISVNADGERESSFIDVRCFGVVAESVSKNLRKGSKCAITGKIEQRNFMRHDGTKGSKFEVNADSVEFLDPKPAVTEEQEAEEAIAKLNAVDLPEDDLPFNEEETKPQEKVKPSENPEPKFDPYTGKPLKPKAKK